jgi:phosphoglucosamine mutase
MADRDGCVYDGDQLLYVIAMDYRRRGALAASGIVGTLMSNLGFEQALAREGIALERAPVGDRYVLERMIEKRWQLGGENSGHLLCLDKHTTGDAIVSALAVLRALVEQKATLAAAAAPVTLFPQRLINVRIRRATGMATRRSAPRSRQRAALGDGGRILLRPSGTEPVLRVMVEAADATPPTPVRPARGRRITPRWKTFRADCARQPRGVLAARPQRDPADRDDSRAVAIMGAW